MIKLSKQIPNILTLLNLFLGCLAILHLFKGEVTMACLLVFVAACIDFLDGFVARLLNAQSELGAQLDSLADCVTFGVVPAMMMYQLLAAAYQLKENAIDTSSLYYFPGLLIACAAAYRLAKFNITKNEQKDRFLGMPTPFMALLVTTLPLMVFNQNSNVIVSYILTPWILYIFIAILCFLMISKIPFLNIKPTTFSLKNNITRVGFILVSFLLIVFFKYLSGILIFIAYLIFSYLEFFIIQKKTNNEI
jgi:CDP-diacylglycerol--serine O-phosphatidyltransferase